MLGTKKISIKRNYLKNYIVIDYFGGACVKYTYDGKWICG